MSEDDVAALTVRLLSAYLANNTVASEDLAGLIRTTKDALTGERPAAEAEPETFTPAVSVRKSLASPDSIISLIDGKPYKTLKRHLASHGLTPDTYRERYNLPANYPIVAPAYAEHRRAIAERMGLGSRKIAAEVSATSATDLTRTARADARPPAPSASGVESPQSDTAAAPGKLTKSAPTKRSAKPAGIKATQKGRGKSKADAKPADSTAPVGEFPPASDVAADDQKAGVPAENPKRRSKLGLFKNSDPKLDLAAE